MSEQESPTCTGCQHLIVAGTKHTCDLWRKLLRKKECGEAIKLKDCEGPFNVRKQRAQW